MNFFLTDGIKSQMHLQGFTLKPANFVNKKSLTTQNGKIMFHCMKLP